MRIPRRRRLEKKTDYKSRFALLKSGEPRLIARKTNNYIIAQIIETKHAQDKVVIGITSKVLLKKGWPDSKAGSLKSLPAAYLTGFVIGKLAKDKKIKSAIFDMGMNRNIHKSRLYAFLRGAIDAGLSIPHNPDALPSTDSLKKHNKFGSIIESIKEK